MRLWEQVQREAGIPLDKIAPCWMIGDANEVNERVEQLNLFSHKIRGNMRCDDVEQLFTNIPHHDLLQKIS